MPRYYFNILDEQPYFDEDGLELPGALEARTEAVRAARSIILEQVLGGIIDLRPRIEVEDEDHRPVLTLPFAAAIQIKT